jgi:hypothetical protein
MYRMFIMNQRVVCRKDVMPYDYPPHMGNSSWLIDQGQTLAHFKSYLKDKANNSSQCSLASKQFHKPHYKAYIHKTRMHSRAT